MSDFKFQPSKFVPYFDDQEACEKVRNIKREDIGKTSNPDLKVTVVKDDDMAFMRIWDIFSRIKEASEKADTLVLILPQPHHQYRKGTYLINKHRIV